MNWDAELAYFVTPKSGPMRAMRTLHDVKYALLDDLTARYRHRRHWFLVGQLLLTAADNKTRLSVTFLTDALLMALEIEGWMAPQRQMREASVHCPTRAPKRELDQSPPPMALAA